jgi:BirA family transcriptional regulator, biotin operon repressor / biotin---[acetyl-CoA-carboxylase] ligase
MEPLDAAAIDVPGAQVRVLERCRSTNTALFAEPLGEGPILLAAEAQSAGRGRRGRRWHSAPGAGITFSLAQRVRRPARELAALSLVAGIAVARAIRGLGVAQATLKWPNDLLVADAKLGGILVETRLHGTSASAVLGVGINCRRVEGLEKQVRRRVAFLGELVDPPPSRNAVIASIARALLEALDAFERHGFAPLRPQWEAMHAHAGRRLRVRLAGGRIVAGVAAGLEDDGALRLSTEEGVCAVRTGHVLSASPA